MWTWKHIALQEQNGLPGHCIEIIVIVVTPYVNLKTHYIARTEWFARTL